MSYSGTSLNEVSSSLRFEPCRPIETDYTPHAYHYSLSGFEKYKDNGMKSLVTPFDPRFLNYEDTSNIGIPKVSKDKSYVQYQPSTRERYDRHMYLPKKNLAEKQYYQELQDKYSKDEVKSDSDRIQFKFDDTVVNPEENFQRSTEGEYRSNSNKKNEFEFHFGPTEPKMSLSHQNLSQKGPFEIIKGSRRKDTNFTENYYDPRSLTQTHPDLVQETQRGIQGQTYAQNKTIDDFRRNLYPKDATRPDAMTYDELLNLQDPFTQVKFIKFKKDKSLLLNDEWSEILNLTEGDFKAIMHQIVNLSEEKALKLEAVPYRLYLNVKKAYPSNDFGVQLQACEKILKYMISEKEPESKYQEAFGELSKNTKIIWKDNSWVR